MEIEKESFTQGVLALADSVYSFHERFQIGCVDTTDSEGTFEALRQRLVLLSEETGEHARALNRADVEGAVQEAVDIAYIAIGTVLRLGDAGRSACLDVSRRNDAKTPSTHSKRSDTGKVLQK